MILHPSQVNLKTYTGESIKFLGELNTKVQYKNQVKSLNLIVISGDGPTLLGRNWLRHTQLNWKQMKAIVAESW